MSNASEVRETDENNMTMTRVMGRLRCGSFSTSYSASSKCGEARGRDNRGKGVMAGPPIRQSATAVLHPTRCTKGPEEK